MPLMLSNDDAASVLTMTETIDALEAFYADLGSGSAVYRGRTDLFAPTSADIGEDGPAASGQSYVGLAFLFSSSTGELISSIQDGLIKRFPKAS